MTQPELSSPLTGETQVLSSLLHVGKWEMAGNSWKLWLSNLAGTVRRRRLGGREEGRPACIRRFGSTGEEAKRRRGEEEGRRRGGERSLKFP
jgi:hypothetical protein